MVVAPKSTLGNWIKEIQRFCPVLRAVKFLGNPEERVSLKVNSLIIAENICWHVTDALLFCCAEPYKGQFATAW